MKSLVVYSTQTGNTKKLAEAVYDALPDEKEILPITEAKDPEEYDFVAVGFWFMGGKPDPNTMQYLPKIGAKKLFLFGTHGVPKDSPEAANGMNVAKQLASMAEVVGCFNCPGQLSPKLLEMAGKETNLPPWLKDTSISNGHPDENDINEIKELVTKAAENF